MFSLLGEKQSENDVGCCLFAIHQGSWILFVVWDIDSNLFELLNGGPKVRKVKILMDVNNFIRKDRGLF